MQQVKLNNNSNNNNNNNNNNYNNNNYYYNYLRFPVHDELGETSAWYTLH